VVLAPRLLPAASLLAMAGAGWALVQDFTVPAALLAGAVGCGGIALLAPNP
jgi:hypothetical protein